MSSTLPLSLDAMLDGGDRRPSSSQASLKVPFTDTQSVEVAVESRLVSKVSIPLSVDELSSSSSAISIYMDKQHTTPPMRKSTGIKHTQTHKDRRGKTLHMNGAMHAKCSRTHKLTQTDKLTQESRTIRENIVAAEHERCSMTCDQTPRTWLKACLAER
eukprot:m.64000 g.64000  ORF g.64000 m.64000 type:complete len:159 (-) comp11985_c0_seq1:1127-1603(-)